MKAKTVQVAFRLPEWLVQKIDAAAEDLSRKVGFKINRTQAVHRLILGGLESLNESASRLCAAEVHFQDVRLKVDQGLIPSNDPEYYRALERLHFEQISEKSRMALFDPEVSEYVETRLKNMSLFDAVKDLTNK